jgi:hypothetical protein
MCRFLHRLLSGPAAFPDPPPDEPVNGRKPPMLPLPDPSPDPDEGRAHDFCDSPPPGTATPYEGRAKSADHLTDELKRLEQLIRAYLLRRKSAYQLGAHAQPDPSGFPADCQAILRADFLWDAPVAERDCHRQRALRLAAFRAQEVHVTARLRRTPDEHRKALRTWELVQRFGLVPDLSDVVPLHGRPPANSAAVRETLLLDLVLLALLADRSPRYRAALSLTEEGASPAGLTAETALRIAQPDAEAPDLRWDAFAPTGPLLAHGLIVLGEADLPARRLVRIDPRIAAFLLGKHSPNLGLGEAVELVTEPHTIEDLGIDPPARDEVRRLAAWWRQWHPTQHGAGRFAALLHGPYGSPTLQAARAFWIGEKRGWQLLAVDVAKAPGGVDWLPFVRRVYREGRLRGRAVLWRGAEALLAEAAPARWEALVAEAETFGLPTFFASEAAWDPAAAFHHPAHIFVRVEFPVPAPPTRRAIWLRLLAQEQNPLAARPRTDEEKRARAAALDLLESFQFTEGQIADAVATARGLALGTGGGPADAEQLYEACRRQSARRLVSFAQRIQPRPEDAIPEKQKEEELRKRVVVSEATAQHLVELFRRMRNLTAVYHGLGFEHRLALGRGLVALFTGPSGTGKTLAATTLAGLLRKDLYKVDMAAVVSKFVGETEKNLGRVFADAQDANAVLFFDEADALFGKRGDVEQAQDRWANLEVNFLLQRVEEYTGTVILATNFRQNIDEAFLRRVQVLIDFPKPSREARRDILVGMFRGTGVPAPDVATVLQPVADRFDELTGGNLKNVVLDAVFRAVDESPRGGAVHVTLQQLVLGVAREYQKLGKPITAATFGREWYGWVEEELKLGRA